jgi:hypothetical protein
MKPCAVCGRNPAYIGAACTECGSPERPELDWDTILTRVSEIDVPEWVESPMK